MAGRGQALWLPKSGVMVCLKPGEDLTDQELEALDEWFVLVKEVRRVNAATTPARDRD